MVFLLLTKNLFVKFWHRRAQKEVNQIVGHGINRNDPCQIGRDESEWGEMLWVCPDKTHEMSASGVPYQENTLGVDAPVRSIVYYVRDRLSYIIGVCGMFALGEQPIVDADKNDPSGSAVGWLVADAAFIPLIPAAAMDIDERSPTGSLCCGPVDIPRLGLVYAVGKCLGSSSFAKAGEQAVS